jgi:hypothetical protein
MHDYPVCEQMLKSSRKEWRRPRLHKLPIAATASSPNGKAIAGDEGNCGGKGDAHNCVS